MATPRRRAGGELRGDGRERLLDAAVRLIAREGFEEARVARIATEAGVSPGLVHYHFASREALLAEALEHSYARAGAARVAPDGDADAPVGVASTLIAMVDQCLPSDGALRDDWVLWVELWLRGARDATLRPTAARLYADLHAWFAAAIAAGVAAGELRDGLDVDRVVDRLLALIDGYGVRALIGDPAVGVARARAEIWAALAADLRLPPTLPQG